MGIKSVQNDPECSDNATRNFHGEKIQAILDGIFPKKTTAEWLKELTDADILVTEVVTHKQVLASEQARTNGYLIELDHPVAGKMMVTGCPLSLNGEVEHEAKPVPEHGQHRKKFCSKSGYSWEEIAALRESEVISPWRLRIASTSSVRGRLSAQFQRADCFSPSSEQHDQAKVPPWLGPPVIALLAVGAYLPFDVRPPLSLPDCLDPKSGRAAECDQLAVS